MHEHKIIIAIDGYSSSGKSTMARTLARQIGYAYIDSGAMYRAVTLYALRNGYADGGHLDAGALEKALSGVDITFATASDGSTHTMLNGEDVEKEIRSPQVAEMVSPVAALAPVRNLLTRLQQKMGDKKGIVMDGRDIGTTVFPNAEMKVFVDASPEERARRRTRELLEKGYEADFDEVLANIKQRDHIDTTRKESPLRRAQDAHVLDNDAMSIGEQEKWLLNLYHSIVDGDTQA